MGRVGEMTVSGGLMSIEGVYGKKPSATSDV